MQRRRPAGARVIPALVGAVLLGVVGCTGSADPGNGSPTPAPGPRTSRSISLSDVTLSGRALDEREGIVLCGDRIVAAPPAGGIERDAFAVFDPVTGTGDATRVTLPTASPLEPNARWLLMVQCVDEAPGESRLLVSYQEMPLPETGGVGVRAGYRLDGTKAWLRGNLNIPAALSAGALVLGAAPAQPERVVSAVTGRTLRTFQSPLSTQLVLSTERMVLNRAGAAPLLTNLAGRTVAELPAAGSWVSTQGVLFGFDRRSVVAIDQQRGQTLWRRSIRPDPLGTPAVDVASRVAVVVDKSFGAHGVDLDSGEPLWRIPTSVAHPRVTAAAGIVLIDQPEEDFQLLVDARTGTPLPPPPQPVVDLNYAGALVMVDGSPELVSVAELRNPPTPAEG